VFSGGPDEGNATVDDLILRVLQGGASPEEERAVQDWRHSAAPNERHYRELARLWALTDLASAHYGGARRRPTAAELLGGAVPVVERAHSRPAPPRLGARRRWLVGGLAAAALISTVAGSRWWIDDAGTFGSTEFVTGAEQMVTARLGDGSVVRLAPRSRLRVVASRHRRDVWLDGRAYFAVARQEGAPFTVHTRLGEAVAHGTRFELAVVGTDLRLLTVEGRVALTAGRVRVDVRPGEMSRVTGGTTLSVEHVDVDSLLDWTGNFLAFQATPLEDVGREIEHHYGVQIRVLDSTLAGRTVTAWFSDERMEDVIAVVCRVVSAECVMHDNTIELRPRPPTVLKTFYPDARRAVGDL
jgi:transmembrane sensor